MSLSSEYQKDWDKFDHKIDGKSHTFGYSVNGDPCWSALDWKYEDEDDKNERYSRDLINQRDGPNMNGRTNPLTRDLVGMIISASTAM